MGALAVIVASTAGIAAFVVAIRVIWFKAVRPLVRAIVLLEVVAAEFRPNEGETMRDSINRIESKLDAVCERVENGLLR